MTTASDTLPSLPNADADPSIEDAVTEQEDDVSPHLDSTDAPQDSVDPPQIPNNHLCFTEEDFMRVTQEHNDATRHYGIYNNTWDEV